MACLHPSIGHELPLAQNGWSLSRHETHLIPWEQENLQKKAEILTRTWPAVNIYDIVILLIILISQQCYNVLIQLNIRYYCGNERSLRYTKYFAIDYLHSRLSRLYWIKLDFT